jgi:hypothetical protein
MKNNYMLSIMDGNHIVFVTIINDYMTDGISIIVI